MKQEMLAKFKELYKGKRLLAVQLNGFNHSIFYDNGKTDSEIDIERYSLYHNMDDDKAKTFFEALKLNHHLNFKHEPKEYLFVRPLER